MLQNKKEELQVWNAGYVEQCEGRIMKRAVVGVRSLAGVECGVTWAQT